jgi:molecular chaperone DnaJ
VVQVPDKLTEEQKTILNNFDEASGTTARRSTDSSGDFSFGGHKRKGRKK